MVSLISQVPIVKEPLLLRVRGFNFVNTLLDNQMGSPSEQCCSKHGCRPIPYNRWNGWIQLEHCLWCLNLMSVLSRLCLDCCSSSIFLNTKVELLERMSTVVALWNKNSWKLLAVLAFMTPSDKLTRCDLQVILCLYLLY